MDISAYAISQAPPEIANRLLVGDVRIEADYGRAKTLAGLKGNQKFDAIIDEDMIECLTDQEAVASCTLFRKYANAVMHLISDFPHLSAWYNYHTLSEWKALCEDKWFSRFYWVET